MSRKNFQGFAIVLYNESESDLQKLKKFNDIFGIYPYAKSPLHCRDVSSDGKIKKPHWHVLFPAISGLKSVLEKKLNVYVEYVYDFVGYYHYLYHYDVNTMWYLPKKAQYWKADIIVSDSFFDYCDDNGFDLFVSSFDKQQTKTDILPQVVSFLSNFTEYSEVLETIIRDDFPVELRQFIIDNNFLVTNYITSNRHRLERVENARKTAIMKDKDLASINELLVAENKRLRDELQTIKKFDNIEFIQKSPFNQFDFFDKFVNK